MTNTPVPIRRGVPSVLSLDADALALLRELCPSKKGYGHFLSSLIRTEVRVREERQKMRQLLETLDAAAPVAQPAV
jgi:hypothetical protein